MTDAFDKVLAEARADFGTREAKGVDWGAVDAALFGRIEQERRADRARFSSHRRRGWTLAAVGLATAAAIGAVLAGKTRDSVDVEAIAVAESAGTVVSIEGDGHDGSLLVDGEPAAPGAGLRLGDVLETRGVQVTIERPGKLTLTLEPGSRTVVTHVKGSLVLALEQGAVEAQVVPVASGEAFAVDVEGSRVAVHGTHLRVERAGEHVVVDLNEGVIAVGVAPREGSVLGTLVNAPAHVEFTASDAVGTLTQTHDPSAVRRPAMRRSAAAVDRPLGMPRPVSSASRPSVAANGEARGEVRGSAGGAAKAAVAAPAPEPSPEGAIANAVRACMAERPRADNVTLIMSTTLHLDLTDDGTVRAARFDPPVAPDVNACAAQAIYRSRFAFGGAVAIAVDFTN